MDEPHHASNLTALNNNHTEFEKYVDVNRNNYKIEGNSLSSSLYQNVVITGVGDLMRNMAWQAKSLVPLAQESGTYEEAGNVCVQNAIASVTQSWKRWRK